MFRGSNIDGLLGALYGTGKSPYEEVSAQYKEKRERLQQRIDSVQRDLMQAQTLCSQGDGQACSGIWRLQTELQNLMREFAQLAEEESRAINELDQRNAGNQINSPYNNSAVSYTHLRAHET